MQKIKNIQKCLFENTPVNVVERENFSYTPVNVVERVNFFFFFLWFSSNLNFQGSSTIPNHNSPKLLLLLLFPLPHLPVKADNRNIEVNNKNDIALVSWTYFTPCSSVSIAIFKHVIANWVNTNFNVGTDVTSDQDARVIEISLDNRNSALPNVYLHVMS